MAKREYPIRGSVTIEDPEYDGEDNQVDRGGTLIVSALEVSYGNEVDDGVDHYDITYSFHQNGEHSGEYTTEEEFIKMWGPAHQAYLKKQFQLAWENAEEVD